MMMMMTMMMILIMMIMVMVFRNKVMKSIGHAFALMGQYSDAATSYERVLDQTPVRV